MSRASVLGPSAPLKQLTLYSSRTRLYVIGYDDDCGRHRVLKLNRQDVTQLEATEEPASLTLEQCNSLLQYLQEANANSGGLQLVCEAHGIIGCFRFTEGFYLLVIARREYAGHICGHKVYRVAETSLIPLSACMQGLDAAPADSVTERRYRKLLLGVDLTRDFFFSYTYSLAHTLQRNHVGGGGGGGADDAAAARARAGRGGSSGGGSGGGGGAFDSMFVWNAYLTRALRAATGGDAWAVPLVHGFWSQRVVSAFGRQLTLTLLARRSRHFAGTRFRKRGLNDQGKVANEVEVEQVVDAGAEWGTGLPLWSSVVQVRGSIPLFWGQQATPLSPKPDILLQQYDPLYSVTAAHFDDLRARYGNPIVALNLLKSSERRPRETLLRREYAAAVSLLNQLVPEEQRVAYIPWDLQKVAKTPGANILLEMSTIVKLALEMTGIYVHNPATCPGCLPVVEARLSRFSRRMHATASQRPYMRPRRGTQRTPRSSAGGGLDSTAAAASPPPPPTSPYSNSVGVGRPRPTRASPAAAPPPAPPQPLPLLQLRALRLGAPHTRLQRGVLRTNCIDCLDRTNVAQFAYGVGAFGRQLHALGLLDTPDIDSDTSAALVLMEQYEAMGHELARQYGGSEAHAAFFQRKKGEWEAATQGRDLMTSIRRFYSNTYTDAEKQDAINLFLGNFIPEPGQPALWDLDTDAYLHSGPRALQGEAQVVRQVASGAPMRRAMSALSVQAAAALHAAADADQGTASTPLGYEEGGLTIETRQLDPATAACAEVGSTSSLLLPLTYSDGLTLDTPDTPASSVDAGWDFRAVFHQLKQVTPMLQLTPAEPSTPLLCMDRILAKQPRQVAVRLYPTTTARRSLVWDAVAQAFTFFTAEPAAVGVQSEASWFVQDGLSMATPQTPDASSHGGSSAHALDTVGGLSKSPVPASALTTAGTASPLVPGTPLSAALPSLLAPSQLFGGIGVGGGTPMSSSGRPIPVLNDFLEIRRDAPPARPFPAASRPSYGSSANRWLDATLEQMAWAAFAGGGGGSAAAGAAPPVSPLNDILDLRNPLPPAAAPAAAAPPASPLPPAAGHAAAGPPASAETPASPSLMGGLLLLGRKRSLTSDADPTSPGGPARADSRDSTAGSAGGGTTAAAAAASRRPSGGDAEGAGGGGAAAAAAVDPSELSGLWYSAPDLEGLQEGIPSLFGAAPAESAAEQQHGLRQLLAARQGGGAAGVASSAQLVQVSLEAWLAHGRGAVGAEADVAAVWWGDADVHERWGAAEAAARRTYQQYLGASVPALLAPRTCLELRAWYQAACGVTAMA